MHSHSDLCHGHSFDNFTTLNGHDVRRFDLFDPFPSKRFVTKASSHFLNIQLLNIANAFNQSIDLTANAPGVTSWIKRSSSRLKYSIELLKQIRTRLCLTPSTLCVHRCISVEQFQRITMVQNPVHICVHCLSVVESISFSSTKCKIDPNPKQQTTAEFLLSIDSNRFLYKHLVTSTWLFHRLRAVRKLQKLRLKSRATSKRIRFSFRNELDASMNIGLYSAPRMGGIPSRLKYSRCSWRLKVRNFRSFSKSGRSIWNHWIRF